MVVAPKTSYRGMQQYIPRQFEQTKTRTKTRAREKARYILSVIVVTLATLLLLTRYAFIIETQYKVEKLKAEVAKIASENESLKVKIADLKSTERIEKIAKANLKMQEPDNEQIRYLER
ncbi:cell division protein FtsL [Thermovorax subterraneus]|nr:cell division protein FtsL [Thermovorax subterraneus]